MYHEAAMNAYVLLLVTFLTFAHAQQQIAVNVNINNKDTPVLANQLSAELTRANLQQVTITQSINEEILVDICTPGTYSYAGASACTNCPSGTSSPIEGATNAMVCHSCSAGTWALGGSPTCTNCRANSFSTTFMASNYTTCVDCPPHSTSPSGSSQVQSCVCDNGYFMSNNLLSPFDSILTTLGFELAGSINVPHIVC
jgi:hypothetical protein